MLPILNLWKVLADERGWTGSLDDLVDRSNKLVQEFPAFKGHHLPLRTRSTAINYRSQNIISPAKGKTFVWHHLVQFCAARYLFECGWKRNDVATWIQSRTVEGILDGVAAVRHPASLELEPAPAVDEAGFDSAMQRAYRYIHLLAAGVVEQYQCARRGMPIIQSSALNSTLSRAMMGLAGLYLAEGKDDTAGSVHDLLVKCTFALNDPVWGLDVLLSPNFPYRSMRLIDPDARLPTLDCIELATQTKSELDLREQLAFEALRSASDQFAMRAAEVYSLMRGYITEHPVTTVDELRVFEQNNDLQPARAFLNSCYEPVKAHHLVDGRLYLCKGCKVPMGRFRQSTHVTCRTPQCEQFDRPISGAVQKHLNDGLRIARPHILAYWVAPGIDELAIFRKAQTHGLQPILYPERDTCDIALDGGKTGVDVKSYTSPFLLAEKLTRSLQGLTLYDVRIVAVNDQCVARFPGYLDLLRREYRGQSSVEFMQVKTLLARLEELH